MLCSFSYQIKFLFGYKPSLHQINFWYGSLFPIVYIYTVWFQFPYRINAAFGVSKAFVPYRLPLSDNTWVKSSDLFPSHRTEFDVSNSHVYTYTNKFLNKVVVSIELKAATAISSTTGVLAIASNIVNIPPKTVYYAVPELTNDFECCILKNNANGSLAFKVTTGTMSSGTTFNVQFEYTYGLD